SGSSLHYGRELHFADSLAQVVCRSAQPYVSHLCGPCDQAQLVVSLDSARPSEDVTAVNKFGPKRLESLVISLIGRDRQGIKLEANDCGSRTGGFYDARQLTQRANTHYS